MLQAMLHGKLSREQENMEDLLTSQVFGTLKYAAPHEGLLPWLRHAEDLDGHRPFVDVSERCAVLYKLWPCWTEPDCFGCEPDAVLEIAAENLQMIVAVEAKHLSGKSSEADATVEAPADQLAREWDYLKRIADENCEQPVLLYVTADYAIPRAEIEASINEYRTKRPADGLTPQICWLPWRRLPELLRGHKSPALADLAEFVSRLDLCFFEGVRLNGPLPTVQWQFVPEILPIETAPKFSWTISTPVPTNPWSFNP